MMSINTYVILIQVTIIFYSSNFALTKTPEHIPVKHLQLAQEKLEAEKTESEVERSFYLQTSGNSIRMLDYFRNKRRDLQCNPETNIYPCGALEFLGCSGNKKFYSQSIIRLNWFEAWEFCRSNGLHLASVESNYEQVFMELFLPKPESGVKEGYWLSGTDFGREGLFFWMTNGHSFTFTNWRPSEPNNFRGQEHCVQMIATTVDHETMKWNDIPCNEMAYAVCEENYMRMDRNTVPDRVAVP